MKKLLTASAVLTAVLIVAAPASAQQQQPDLIEQAARVLGLSPDPSAAPTNAPAKQAPKQAPKQAQNTQNNRANNNGGGSLLDSLDTLFSNSPALSGNISSSRKPASNNAAAFDTSYKTANSVLLVNKLTAGKDPNAAQTKALIEFVNKAWSQYQTTTLQNGLKFNDVAAAGTYAVNLNYAIYNGTEPQNLEQNRAVYAQMKQFAQQNKNFAAMSDADKQMQAEMIVVRATVPALFLALSRQPNSGVTQDEARELAAKNLADLLGNDFANLRFTDNGLER